jgi:DNA-binding response OmpR family regulator
MEPEEPMSEASRQRILVVDDDRDTTELTALVLAGAGYAVEQANSGEEALRSALADPPDLVLLDINMHAMDGWETLRLLRTDSGTRRTPVAMFSVRYDLREKLQGMQMGATDYITKPFEHDDLVRRVERILEEAGGDAGAAPV